MNANKLLKILILILSILLIILVGLGILRYTQKKEPSKESQEESISVEIELETKTEEVVESTESTQEETAATTEEIVEEEKDGFIIIGDSHTVVTDGQGYTSLGSTLPDIKVKENLFFVHTFMDPVMGTYEWFSTEGPTRIQQIIDENPGITKWSIISIHGTSMVTVPGITNSYISTYKKWIEDTFKDHDIYIVSVPPLDEAEWVVRHPDFPPRYNKDVKKFNKAIKSAYEDRYFDYFEWFNENGHFQDEIHYTGETYRNMFDEIITKIREK